ncbi:MAG: hypothetical protein ACU0DW_10630 [Shimia sp.]
MMSACGVTHVERNGHHFAGGFRGASAAEQARFADAHPDIYTRRPEGPLGLNIANGAVAITSLNTPDFAGARPDIPNTDGTERRAQ